jgi:hypothetical protein
MFTELKVSAKYVKKVEAENSFSLKISMILKGFKVKFPKKLIVLLCPNSEIAYALNKQKVPSIQATNF